MRGAVPADDPRTLAHLRGRASTSWASDGYVYRFRHDERPLGEAEGAFVLCGFPWRWPCTSRAGRSRRSAGSSATGPRCGPPGLFSEEYDVTQRQLRGNLPQAFVHALHAGVARTRLGARPSASARPADPTTTQTETMASSNHAHAGTWS